MLFDGWQCMCHIVKCIYMCICINMYMFGYVYLYVGIYIYIYIHLHKNITYYIRMLFEY